jgi:hypothetical protein
MKLIKNPIVYFSLAMFSLGLTACSTHHPVAPMGGGYEEESHPSRSGDTRVAFQYRAPDGKITPIWPALYGVAEVIHGDVAIFVGEKAYVSPDPDDPRGTKPRLFAVRSPALPMDITDAVLWRWSKAAGKDFAKALDQFSMVTTAERDGRLQLQLEFWTEEKDWPDKTTVQLGWDQVSAIMREVMEKGTLRKDPRWGTPYIEK